MNFSNTTAEVTSNLIAAGEAKVKRPLHKMIILGIFAGMLIGAGAMASSVAMHDIANVGLARLVAGLVFPIGFVMMVLFGGELFTGACLMIMGLLKGKYNVNIMPGGGVTFENVDKLLKKLPSITAVHGTRIVKL